MEPRQKTFQTMPFDTLESMQKKLQMTDAEFAGALGYSGSPVISGWRKEGKCPKVATIAAEGLIRRLGPDAVKLNGHDRFPQAVVIKVQDAETLAFLELMLERTKGINVLFKGN